MPRNPLTSYMTVRNAEQEKECTEEEAFYKIMSGMQTLIMVLNAEYYKTKKSAAEQFSEIESLKKAGSIIRASTFRSQYSPNFVLFKDRIAPYREWLENQYFTFAVLLKTFCHIHPILETCDCDTGIGIHVSVSYSLCHLPFVCSLPFVRRLSLYWVAAAVAEALV